MAKKPRENRIPIMMSDDELTAVDDWRYANRIATRSDAVRRLSSLGILAGKGLLENFEEIINGSVKLIAKENKLSKAVFDAKKAVEKFGAPPEGKDSLIAAEVELNEFVKTVFDEFEKITNGIQELGILFSTYMKPGETDKILEDVAALKVELAKRNRGDPRSLEIIRERLRREHELK